MSDRRLGDPPILIAKAERVAQLLDWKAKHSDLKTIIKTAWDWHKTTSLEKSDNYAD